MHSQQKESKSNCMQRTPCCLKRTPRTCRTSRRRSRSRPTRSKRCECPMLYSCWVTLELRGRNRLAARSDDELLSVARPAGAGPLERLVRHMCSHGGLKTRHRFFDLTTADASIEIESMTWPRASSEKTDFKNSSSSTRLSHCWASSTVSITGSMTSEKCNP